MLKTKLYYVKEQRFARNVRPGGNVRIVTVTILRTYQKKEVPQHDED